VPRGAQRLDEPRQPRRSAELVRHLGSLEVGAERDVLDADPRRHVIDVLDDHLEGDIRVGPAVLPEEHRGEVDPDHSAGFTDRIDLPVG
jgi:hypothetical protein